ncbi:MAG: Hint domain-containing protein [Pseudomonadota bacterium]
MFGTSEGIAFIGGEREYPPIGVTLTVTSTSEGPNFLATAYGFPPCCVSGSQVLTPTGAKPIDALSVGDLVVTQNHGLKPIRWIGRCPVTATRLHAQEPYRPIVFEKDALGPNTPSRRTRVSPQHRVAISDGTCEILFDCHSVLVKAKDLVNGESIYVDTSLDPFAYIHILFDSHALVFVDGMLSESFYPGADSLQSLDHSARAELRMLFPELFVTGRHTLRPALPTLRDREARALLRAQRTA